MKTFLNSFGGSLLAIVLVVAIVAGYATCAASKKSKIHDGSYLVIAIHGDLPEYDPPGGLMSKIAGGGAEITLNDVLENLRKARVDDRIDGVILKVSMGASIGGGSAQEIRNAIKRLQADGKKVYGYGESFEAREYHVLAACDEILAPETAYIGFAGFARNRIYVKNALAKLGIEPNIHKIKDYKSAAELVIRENMSEPARENAEWLLSEGWDFLIDDLGQDRGFSEEKIVEMMDHAIFTAAEALDAGLIDRLMYWDQVEDMLKGEEDKLQVVSNKRYNKEDPEDLGLEGDKTIAVIHAQGTIVGRTNGVNPLLGVTMGHETIVEELRRAREDEDVAAVVFRVDSPGGDALGSDLMGHEVELTTGVKPVVVSMVNVAASGGYHISYRATKIIADPGTVTGSIGSISGKFNTSGMYEKLGINHDSISRGPKALMGSEWRDYTEEERARFEEDHWTGFNHWLKDVSEHRGMSFEAAEKLAHGRVWSGRQAAANGLVDELGDLEHAITVAKELAGIDAEEEVTLAHYPEQKSLIQGLLSGDVAAAARWAVYRAVREDASQTWDLITQNPELVVEQLTPQN